ncbi:MAG: hypothetical protein WAW06_11610 [bacterium]
MRSAIVFVAVTLLLAGSLSAQTWYVKHDGSGDQPTIQAAVDAAASGDTILLANGTFTGDGNRDIEFFYSWVTVRSEAGDPSYCTIDCGGSVSEPHLAFDVTFGGDAPVVIEGITITNGYGLGAGAMYVGKMASEPCTTVVRHCLFQGNETAWSGGAIMVTDDCWLMLDSCTFVGNTTVSGGAIYLGDNTALSANACHFAENQAINDYGGAIYGYNSACTLNNCVFVDNFATDGGGAIFISDGGALGLYTCSFFGNSAASSGGAIYASGSNLAMNSCVSLHNVCGHDGVGASIYCSEGSTAYIASSTFVADSAAAVIYCGPSVSPTLNQTVIAFAKDGAALACFPPAGTPTLVCCDIYGNELGDYTDCIAAQAGVNNNISQDPRFCDIPGEDLSYEDCSPCLAANSPCGYDIGAVAYVGCGCGEAAVPTTWGAIKALYR